MDDDPAFRGLMSRIVTDLGLAVCAEVGTVQSALESADALRPEAALVDIGLPDGDGAELGKELAALPWGPRVVLTSSDSEGAGKALNNGLPFVPKDELPNAPLWRLLTRE